MTGFGPGEEWPEPFTELGRVFAEIRNSPDGPITDEQWDALSASIPKPKEPADGIDIVAFLTARFDEDQATAHYSGPAHVAWLAYRDDLGRMLYTTVAAGNDGGPWVADGHDLATPASVRVVYDPARLLAEVAAKRIVLEQWRQASNAHLGDEADQRALGMWTALSTTLVALAGAYPTHADYKGADVDDWKWPDET